MPIQTIVIIVLMIGVCVLCVAFFVAWKEIGILRERIKKHEHYVTSDDFFMDFYLKLVSKELEKANEITDGVIERLESLRESSEKLGKLYRGETNE